MNTIQIRQYTPAQLKFYGPDDKFIGFVNNQVEALRLRLDVAKQQAPGYYFMYSGIKIELLLNGGVTNWPNGLYSETHDLCREIANRQLNDVNGKENESDSL